MRAAGLTSILFVHGYSVRSLNSWGVLPKLLQAEGYAAGDIRLSAFVSLDDYVTCDDLAAALEARVAELEAAGLNLRATAIVAHSTGAIVTRRWILNRLAANAAMPRTFVCAAGANHGSTLAQLGKTELARLFRAVTAGTAVGALVLRDLDYGSTFLRRLNRDWLDAWNRAPHELWKQTACFSMGGTDHSFWQNHLTWQSREPGSDGTVRVSGANLNYRIITVEPPYASFRTDTLAQPAPHLVVESVDRRYSHTSQSEADTLGLVLSAAVRAVGEIQHGNADPEPVSSSSLGILEGIATTAERPYTALLEAFAVVPGAAAAPGAPAYADVAAAWARETQAWTDAHPDQAASTIVVSIADQYAEPAQDSLVVLGDQDGSIAGSSASAIGNQIRNAAARSVVTTYVNYGEFHAVHPHRIHVEAITQTEFVSYGVKIDADISGVDADGVDQHVVDANETTYVDVRAQRASADAFRFYPLDAPDIATILDTPYPPFPS